MPSGLLNPEPSVLMVGDGGMPPPTVRISFTAPWPKSATKNPQSPAPNVTLTSVVTGDAPLPAKGVAPIVSCTTLLAAAVPGGVSTKRLGEDVVTTGRSTASF